MKVLLLSSRFPWPPYSGDRIRATVWLEALRDDAQVALVCPPGRVPDATPPFSFFPLAPSMRSAAAGAARIVAGAPAQSIVPAAWNWRAAIEAAREELGAFDATVVLLSRLAPAVTPLLPPGLHILDAIDPLAGSMRERARAAGLSSWLWREESRRVARLEQQMTAAFDRIIVVNPNDAYGTDAISNGISVAQLADDPRTVDFAFWGRLGFFANSDAAAWLIREIWPAIRRVRSDATLVIAGDGAPAFVRDADGRDGIRVLSPADDISSLARTVKVALLPIRFGTGESTKALEAAEAGCAIVATSKGVRGATSIAEHAFVGEDAPALARLAVEAIEDDALRTTAAANLRAAVEQHCDRKKTLQRLAALVLRAEAAA